MKTKIICLSLFIVSIFVLRILDFTMMWNYMSPFYYKHNISYYGRNSTDNMEKNQNGENKNGKISLLKWNQCMFFREIGFSSYSRAKNILNELEKTRKEKIVVVSYFNLFCPLVYLINNKGEKIEVGSREITWEIDKGFMEISFNKGENCRIISNYKEKLFFQIAILGEDTDIIGKMFLGTMHGTTPFTSKVFFFYFYLPFFIILFLSIKIDKSFFISYFYFYEMILLFGPPTQFLSLSNFFIDEIFMIKSLSIYWGYSLLLLISLLFSYGIYCKRKKKNDSLSPFVRNIVITFFIFLPILLRFSHLSLEWLFNSLSRVF